MTDKAPENDVPHARFEVSVEDLPAVVPEVVGPFRFVLLALTAVEDEWQLTYATEHADSRRATLAARVGWNTFVGGLGVGRAHLPF